MILLILPIMGGALVEGVNPKNILLSMVQEEEEEEEEHRPWKRKETYCKFAYFSFRKRNKKQRKGIFFVSKKKSIVEKKNLTSWLKDEIDFHLLLLLLISDVLKRISWKAFLVLLFLLFISKNFFGEKKYCDVEGGKKCNFWNEGNEVFALKYATFFWEKNPPEFAKFCEN